MRISLNEETIISAPLESSGSQTRESITEKKKRRGRPSKAETIAEYEKEKAQSKPDLPPIVIPAKYFEEIGNIPFRLKAWLFRNEGWLLTEDEKQALSEPLADWVNEMLPQIAKDNPKIALVVIVYILTVVKKSNDARIYKKEHEKKQDERKPEPDGTATIYDKDGNPVTGTDERGNLAEKTKSGLTKAEILLKKRSGGI